MAGSGRLRRGSLVLYTQILAFILVMVVFEAYAPARPDLSPIETLLGCLALAAWLWAGCRMSIAWFLHRLGGPRAPLDPVRSARRLSFVLQVGALAAQLAMVTALDLKAHMMGVSWLAASQTLAGMAAAALYVALACLVWSQTYLLERAVMHQPWSRGSFVAGQARFVAPVIFPWFLLSLVSDLTAWLWPGGEAWLAGQWGDLAFLALFALMAAFMFPPLVRGWWGCREVPPGPVRGAAQETLDRLGVKVAAILNWPIMGGRALTAGVLGLVPRLRYLLITPALAEVLSPAEISAVVAHEAGHVKKWHMVKFLGLFMGFFFMAYALAEPLDILLRLLIFWLAGTGWGAELLTAEDGGEGVLSLALALPLVILLIAYLRFAVGYFMRNYERQADLYALKATGSAGPLITSLEKIARLAGNIRDLPSWHHFSVAQRVRALEAAQDRPELIAAHDRKMRRALGLYLAILAAVVVAGNLMSFSQTGRSLGRSTVDRLIEHRLTEQPANVRLRIARGVMRFEQGQEAEALADLNRAVQLAPRNPEALNALAWLYATAKDSSLRRPAQALRLALEAVRLRPAPHIWDTVAEAFYVNGQPAQALAAARSALAARPTERLDYYRKQLARFSRAAGREPAAP